VITQCSKYQMQRFNRRTQHWVFLGLETHFIMFVCIDSRMFSDADAIDVVGCRRADSITENLRVRCHVRSTCNNYKRECWSGYVIAFQNVFYFWMYFYALMRYWRKSQFNLFVIYWFDFPWQVTWSNGMAFNSRFRISSQILLR
jgi:hypothetical protein